CDGWWRSYLQAAPSSTRSWAAGRQAWLALRRAAILSASSKKWCISRSRGSAWRRIHLRRHSHCTRQGGQEEKWSNKLNALDELPLPHLPCSLSRLICWPRGAPARGQQRTTLLLARLL